MFDNAMAGAACAGGQPSCATPRYRHTALRFLERGARLHPGKTAVRDERGSCTYGQLFGRVRRVGSALAGRVEPGTAVVVCMEKGVAALEAMLGALAAGCLYVPVDPDAPRNRLERMCAVLGDFVVLTGEDSFRDARDAFPSAAVLSVDDLARAAEDDGLLGERARAIVDTDPAYVLFTSGSTGVPKGVTVSHRAVIDFIETFVETFGLRPDDVVGNQAPFDFDVSVKDIYGSLAAGAELVVLPRRLFSAPAELVDALAVGRVTVLIWAVAALCLLSRLHGLDRASLGAVRLVMFSGEVMPLVHLRRWMGCLPLARFVNLYGPTEVTCNCLYHVLDRERSYEGGIPLGAPFPNRRVLLLDDRGRRVTRPGEVGELYVGGASVALGYLGDEERTRASFVRDPRRPVAPGILYRTGDLARVGEGGELFFCGRADNQIKHLGHRMELEEIDAAFERQPGVMRCRCAYDARRARICAFFEGEARVPNLRAAVAREIPAALVPARIVRVDDMPLTKNGKVDRARLLALGARREDPAACGARPVRTERTAAHG